MALLKWVLGITGYERKEVTGTDKTDVEKDARACFTC